jgi:hypothetical protein
LTNRSPFEDKIYEEQFAKIKETFGEDAANSANYGWGVDEHEDTIAINTKIYGHGVLTSIGNYNTGEIEHDL